MNSSAILNVSGWKVVFISKLLACDGSGEFLGLVCLKSMPVTAEQISLDQLNEQSSDPGNTLRWWSCLRNNDAASIYEMKNIDKNTKNA